MAFFSRRRAITSTKIPTASQTPATSAPDALSYRALEPRVVFDGAGAAVIAEAVKPADKTVDAQAKSPAANPAHAAVDQNHDALVSSLQGAAAAMSKPSAIPGAIQIVFIENNLPDTATLLANVPKDAQVVMLDAGKDGVDQIAQFLAGRSGIGAIHILSHGQAGEVDLGTAKLTPGSLATTYAADIGIIKAALAPNADILLYGCDIAQGSAGHAFVQALATATGDNVAASTDITGSASHGGNWVLEDRIGGVHTAAIDAKDWNGELAPLVISAPAQPIVSGNGGVGTTIVWQNAGTIGTTHIDLHATITSNSTGVAPTFGTASPNGVAPADDPYILLNNPGSVTLHWEIFLAGSNTVHAVGTPTIQTTDIDGIGGSPFTRETVTPSLFHLTSYTLDNPTNLRAVIAGSKLEISGTQDQNAESTSLASYTWTNVSSWDLTYTLTPNAVTPLARTLMDGNGSLTFVDPKTTYLLSIDLDANNSTATGTSYQATFSGTAVPIVDEDVVITEHAAIGTTIDSAHVVLANAQTGDQLLVNGSTAASGTVNGLAYMVSSTGGRIVVDLNGNATPAGYEVALKAITFENTQAVPSGIDRQITISVTNDMFQTTSDEALSTIHVPIDDAPVNTITPASYTVAEDTPLNLTGISVADVDAGTADVSVTFHVDSGNLTALTSVASGVTASQMTGNGTDTIVITAPIARINATLASTGGLKFLDTLNHNGAVTLTMTTDDLGNTGFGGPLSDTDTRTITVTPVNDAPVEIVPAARTITGGKPVAIPGLSVSDVDANGGLETVTLTVAHGTMTLPSKAGLTFTTGDGTADATIVFKGTLADINAAIAGLTYTSTASYAGVDTLTFTTNDNGNTGSGGALSSGAKTVALTVVPPPNAVDDAFYTTIDTPITVAVLSNDSDANSFPLTVTHIDGTSILAGDPAGVAVTGGTVVLDATGKLTFTPDAGYLGTPTFTYTIDDGHGRTDTATVNGSVTPLNHAPVNVVPDTQRALGGVVTFSTVNGNPVQVTDDASATQIIQTTVAVDTGTLTLAQTAGLTFVKGDGNADATITIQGTKAAINAALDGLRYNSVAGATGSAHLTIATDDLGHPNGEDIPNGSFEATLTAIPDGGQNIINQNQVPGWTTTAPGGWIEIWGTGFLGVPAYEGHHFAELNAYVAASDISVSTVPKGQPLEFSFAHRGRSGVDVMNVTVQDAGADGVFGTADDTTLMNQNYSDGTSAWGFYQKDLGVASGNPVRLIFTAVTSAGGPSVGNFLDAVHLGTKHLTDTDTVTITLNNQPLIDLNSTASTADTARNNTVTFVEGASALKVAAATTDVNDLGEGDITALKIVAGAVKDGAAEIITVAGQAFPANADKTVTATVGGSSMQIAYIAATGTFTITNATGATTPIPQADLDTLVRGITYADNSQNPTAGDRTLTFTATDSGGLTSPAAVATVTVLPLNEAPHLDLSGNTTYSVPGIGTGAFLYGHNAAGAASYSTASNVIAVAGPEIAGSGLALSYSGTHADVTGIASTSFTDAVNGNEYISMSFTSSATLIESWITHVTKLNAGGPNYQFAVAISTDGFQTATLLSKDNQSPSNGSPDSYASGYPNFNGTDFKLAAGTAYEIRAYIYNVAGGAAASINWDDFYVFFHNDSPNYTTTFTENAAAISITDVPVAIEDVNDTNMAGGTVALTNKQAFDQLLIGGNAIASGTSTTIGGITYSVTETAASTTIALSGTATRTAYANALHNIAFQNTSDSPDPTDRIITAVVTDGVETSNIATTTIHVIPVNDAPAGADKIITTLEDTPVTLATSDFGFIDPEDIPANSLLAVKITTLPINGTLTDDGVAVTAGQTISRADITSGKLMFTPSANANGAGLANLTFQVQDNGGTANGGIDLDPAPKTITFDVIPVNDAPVIDLNSAATQTGTNLGTAVTYTENGAAINVASATLADVSDIGEGDIAKLTIVAAGTHDGINEQVIIGGKTFNLATSDTQLINLGGGTVAIIDYNAATGTFSITKATGGVLPQANLATLVRGITYQDAGDNPIAGNRTLTFAATDTGGLTSAPAVATMTVVPVNDPPVAVADTGQTNEDANLVVSSLLAGLLANDSDPEHDPLTLISARDASNNPIAIGTEVTLPSGAKLTLNPNGTYTYKPNGAFNGLGASETATDTFTYTVSDGQGSTTPALVTITIDGRNDAPQSGPLPAVAAKDGDHISLDLGSTFHDPDIHDTLAFTISGLPAGLTYNPATGVVSGTLPADASQNGLYPAAGGGTIYPINVSVSDGSTEITRTFNYTVTNPAPIAQNDLVTTAENTPLTGSVFADNGNGPDLGGPLGDSDRITVGGVVTGTASPVDGVGLNIPVAGSAGGSFTVKPDGSYAFDPGTAFDDLSPGETRTTTVTYKISDGQGGTATAALIVTVLGANDAPVVIDPATGKPPVDPVSGLPLDPVTVAIIPGVAAKDGAPITPVVVAGFFKDVDISQGAPKLSADPAALPPGIIFDPASGTFSGTPTKDASQGHTGSDPAGTYKVPVTATDIAGAKVTTYVTFTITNPAPIAVDDGPVETFENIAVKVPVLTNDHDGGSDTDPIRVVSAASNEGHVFINSDGTVSFTPKPGFVGTATVTYVIADDNGGTASAKITITVKPQIVAAPPAKAINLPVSEVLAPDAPQHIEGALLAAVSTAGGQPNEPSGLQGEPSFMTTTNPVRDLSAHVGQLWFNSFGGYTRDAIGGWNTVSRSGSSIAVDTLAGAGAKSVFVVESMIFDGVLSLAFKPNSAIAGDRQVVEYKVLRADGRPAPDWMERPALDLLQGRRSAESEQIDLSITAVLSDGSSATQTVRVHTSTGVIERIADRRTELAPKLFSEQFAAAGVLSDAQSASLAAALEWNN